MSMCLPEFLFLLCIINLIYIFEKRKFGGFLFIEWKLKNAFSTGMRIEGNSGILYAGPNENDFV